MAVNRDVLKRLRMPSWAGVVPVLAVLTLVDMVGLSKIESPAIERAVAAFLFLAVNP